MTVPTHCCACIMEENATALHKISVMVDDMDRGSTAVVAFVRDYWYLGLLILGSCILVCVVSQCYRCYEVCKCLTCCCRPCLCCCRSKSSAYGSGGRRMFVDDD